MAPTHDSSIPPSRGLCASQPTAPGEGRSCCRGVGVRLPPGCFGAPDPAGTPAGAPRPPGMSGSSWPSAGSGSLPLPGLDRRVTAEGS